MDKPNYHNSPAYQKAWSKYVSDELYSFWNSNTHIPVSYDVHTQFLRCFDHILDLSKVIPEDFLEEIHLWISDIYMEYLETKRKEFDKKYPYV